MAKQRLLSIIDAADPDDCDDIATRRSLVIALSNSGIGLAEMLEDRIPPLPVLCELFAMRRETCPLSAALALISFTTKRSHLAPSQGTTCAQHDNNKSQRTSVYGYRRARQRRPSFPFAACTLSRTGQRNPCRGSG
jgi:hypothetical protein